MGAGLDACWAKEVEGRNGCPWPDRFIRSFPNSKIRKKGERKVRRTRKRKEGKEIGRRGFAKTISKLYFNLRIF